MEAVPFAGEAVPFAAFEGVAAGADVEMGASELADDVVDLDEEVSSASSPKEASLKLTG